MAAHSIYFQVLGEHGYPGLLIYLAMIIVLSGRRAGSSGMRAAATNSPGQASWQR